MATGACTLRQTAAFISMAFLRSVDGIWTARLNGQKYSAVAPRAPTEPAIGTAWSAEWCATNRRHTVSSLTPLGRRPSLIGARPDSCLVQENRATRQKGAPSR